MARLGERGVNHKRWQPCKPFEISGVRFRVVLGSKTARADATGHRGRDLCLEWQTVVGWRPCEMAVGALFADFFYDNEDVLYPRPIGQGGNKYRSYLYHAMKEGWQVADGVLQFEKRHKDDEPSLFDDGEVA